MTSPNTLIADMQSEIDSTRSQLAAAQARILELREALTLSNKMMKFAAFDGPVTRSADKVLSTPDDATALRKLIAKHIRTMGEWYWKHEIVIYANKIEDGSAPL